MKVVLALILVSVFLILFFPKKEKRPKLILIRGDKYDPDRGI